VTSSQGEPHDALPKLTLGQRLLAALPSLQRERPAPAPSPSTKTRARADATKPAADTNGADVVRPDAVISPRGASTTAGARLRDAFLKPPPSGTKSPSEVYAQMSVPDLRHAMKYLDDRERKVALFVGPLVGALDLALMFVTLHQHNPPVGHKGHFDPGQVVALGVGSAVVAALVIVAALVRRRSFTLFALLFAGYGGSVVTLIPAWVTAGWLFVHFNRMQKVVVQKTGGASGRQSAAKARADRAATRRGRRDRTPEPAGPARSKRYTPPKPGASR
jgi:hypothetical protein